MPFALLPLPGFSQAQCDDLLPAFSAIDGATQRRHDEAGMASGPRRRQPGGGTQGPWPTRPAPLLVVLSSAKTAPPFDVRGTPGALARSQAQENLPTRAPIFDETLVACAMMPSRECRPPDDGKAA